jgi:hypothetical protein
MSDHNQMFITRFVTKKRWGTHADSDVSAKAPRATPDGGCVLVGRGDCSVFVRTHADGREEVYSGITRTISGLFSRDTRVQPGKHARGASSMRMGTVVHRHIHHLVSCVDGACDCARKTRAGSTSRLARSFLEYLDRHGLVPLSSETTVFSDACKTATNIDVVCERKGVGRGVCIISVKTGYTSHGAGAGYHMSAPFQDLVCTHDNVHSIQACFEYGAYESVTGSRPDDYLIVYLDPKVSGCVKAVPLSDFWKSRDTYEKLIHSIAEKTQLTGPKK